MQQIGPIVTNDLGEADRDWDADRLTAGNKLVDALQEI